MPRWIAALALALTACASETRYVEPVGQDDGWIRQEAAEAWLDVGVQAPSDYALLFLDQDALADACNADLSDMAEGSKLGGCSLPGVVLLAQDADPDLQLSQLIHELGHIKRGSKDGHNIPGHLDCPGANDGSAFGSDVMCLTTAGPGVPPTLRDAAFVSR